MFLLLTPVPFDLKLFLIHRKADLFTHEQRIIGLAVAGGETERNRNIQILCELPDDHIRDGFIDTAPGTAVETALFDGRYVDPLAADDPGSAVQHTAMFHDRQVAMDMLQVFAYILDKEDVRDLQGRRVIGRIQNGGKGGKVAAYQNSFRPAFLITRTG